MVNVFGEGKAAFVAMPEARQIAQPKNLTSQIQIKKEPHETAKRAYH